MMALCGSEGVGTIFIKTRFCVRARAVNENWPVRYFSRAQQQVKVGSDFIGSVTMGMSFNLFPHLQKENNSLRDRVKLQLSAWCAVDVKGVSPLPGLPPRA